VVAIIQARMGSSRLPGKTLADLEGKPLLARVIERVLAARLVQRATVATTTNPEDEAILDLARSCGLDAYAGSSNNVLDRFYNAAKHVHADVIVRITADDPFKDPDIIDRIIAVLLENRELDYVSNTIRPTFPEGLDVEAFSFDALERAWKEADIAADREHVTPYMWRHPERFALRNVTNDIDLSNLRWTLDYPEDLVFARQVYGAFPDGRIFLMKDILELLSERPELSALNAGFERNAGYKKSLRESGAGKAG